MANQEANPKPAVFIDRDGVINRMVLHPDFGIVDSPANLDQFELLPGVGEAMVELNRLGLLVVVVSNQPGIAKGKFTTALLHAMQDKMKAGIEASGGRVDAIYNCLHHPEALLNEYRAVCDCRKPKPGLLLNAAREWNIDLSTSYMIGDGVTDMAAGCAVGAITLFVNSRKCYHCDALTEQNALPDYLVKDLREAAQVIGNLEAGDKNSIAQFIFNCAVL
jgi:D-glycero-D-manno-heptose 1,7-bisphosphate phosphatase